MFKKKKTSDLNIEINLVPFIDLLSVLISFLLLTAVWVNTAALSTKQGLGTEAQAEKKNDQSLWVELSTKDVVLVSAKGLKTNKAKQPVSVIQLSEFVASIKAKNPDLRTALVLPNVNSSYEEMINAMNSLRKAEFTDIGLAPL
jgi:biopolymer transport protein TolR